MRGLIRKIVTLAALALSATSPALAQDADMPAVAAAETPPDVGGSMPLPGAVDDGDKKDPMNLSTTFQGETGTFRVVSGYTPWRKRFALGAGLQYWQADNYLAPNFFHKHLETVAHVTISPTDWMEVFLAAVSTSHLYQDKLLESDPILVQSIGDVKLGTKFGFEANEFFFLGGDVFFRFNTQQGNLGPAFSATSFGLRALPTFDFTTLKDPVPLRFLVNFGYMRDNTRNVVKNAGGSQHLEYALGIPPDDDILTEGFAVEIPQKFLSIIVEYTSEQYKDFNGNALEPRVYNTSPQRITPGLRFFPVGGLVIDANVDLGAGLLGFTPGVVPSQSLTDQREEIMPNWAANLGLVYNFTPPPPPAPKEGKVRGIVTDARTGVALADVILAFPGKSVTDLITDETGRYKSYSFAAGALEVSAKKENYQPGNARVEVLPGRELTVNFKLVPIEQIGKFAGTVKDDKGKPLLASISFEGTTLPNVATEPLSGNFEVQLPPDVYTVKVVANGFNPDTKRIRVQNRKLTRVNFTLTPIQTFGTLMGKIESADGKPIAGIISFDNPKMRPIAANPDTGQFEEKVEPGTFRIKATAAGFEPAVTTVTLQSGGTALQNFVLSPVITAGTLAGSVVDAKTGKGLYAVISSPTGEFSNIVADPDSGRFVQKLPAGKYMVKAAAPNYKAEEKEVVIENGKTVDVPFQLTGFDKINITREKIEIKEKIRFANGKDTILFDSYPLLDEIGQAIQDNPKMQVSIEGHTDSNGSDAFNLKLSQKRAEAVRDYLIARGIQADRLKATGYGETKPIAPNDTEEGREKNRRVEFNIIAQ
jgi:outer membrane protein OmpA-like peptidoglycan-associated protein